MLADNLRPADEADFEADQAHLSRRARLRALDVLLAVVLVAGNMLRDRPDFTLPFVASCLVGVALGVLVALRRLWPRRVLTAAVALSCVAIVSGVLWDPSRPSSIRGGRPAPSP
ncbi:hypothetical protein [Actinomadura chokoriensis]|uniref:hypothetical protein n=1 Tax=Actinomadura chokoriensis TaxID=454156 RepID=UPI0031F85EAA